MNKSDQTYFTIDQIKLCQKLISDEYNIINKLEQEIKERKKNIEKLQYTLIKNCNHNRVPDRSCTYDHTTYSCDICFQDL